jgi:mRNA-degrading endonuclease RelE of RelBE toxin-antitoxin system
LRAELNEIRANPEGGKRLHGGFSHLRSWRVGAFRILYEYSEGVIRITNIGHRSTVYRQP